MTLAPTDEQQNEQLIADLKTKISELEQKIEEQAKTILEQASAISENAVVEATPKKLAIKDYKQGQFVRIQAPGHADWLDGRVIDHGVGKGSVNVATARGEFPIAHPDRIEAAK